VISRGLLNGALKPIVRTSQGAEGIRLRPQTCMGGDRGGEEGSEGGKCDGFGNSDNLRQRLYERKPKGNGKGVLRLVRSPTEFGFSSRPHAPAGIQSPTGKEGEVGTMTYGLVGPNSQATAQKHNGCPICLGDYALRLGTTPKGLTEAGFRSGWLARWCCGWELAREGGGMIHTGLRAGVRRTKVRASGFGIYESEAGRNNKRL